MILCVGEILADMIGVEEKGILRYERRAGGAPFNVACALAKLGEDAAFVGCVGNDLIGEYLCGYAAARGLKEVHIRRDGARNTTLAFVELDGGERSFCFYRKHTADHHLPQPTRPLMQAADLVHIGSLMLSEKSGRAYAARLADRAHAMGKRVSFDVNYRSDIFPDERTAHAAYGEMLMRADIVKLSEDEAALFEDVLRILPQTVLVLISLGAKGSEWHFRGSCGHADTVPVAPVDTTGAGDAFFAGALAKLACVPSAAWSAGFLTDVLRFANACGALNTRGRGAIDGLPTRAEAEAHVLMQSL